MDITNNIKNGLVFVGETVSEIAASVAEKNRLRVQLNHIKGLIKADSATRDQAYVELGRYFYENLREGTSPENEAICAVIDAANDRISKASLKYVELLNIQNDTKIRSENAEKLAKAVSEKAAATAKVAKEKGAEALDKAKAATADLSEKAKVTAADLAEKAKVTAADLKDKAADKAEELKERFDPEANEDLEELIAAEQEKIAEAAEEAADEVKETVEEVKEAVENSEESPEDIGF
ncbi:MAG: hypothetical protein IJV48_00690 [Ruminococcus sp.]|nr:hypothetical protein [Ruminococcus sp.]